MYTTKYEKFWLCIMLVFCIALGGFTVRYDQGNGKRDFAAGSVSLQEVQTSLVHMEQIHRGALGIDCRLEDSSTMMAWVMYKMNVLKNRKVPLVLWMEGICLVALVWFQRGIYKVYKQYDDKSDSIVKRQRLLVSYIHRKDGDKGASIFRNI